MDNFTKERFLDDIKNHKMTILLDEGVNRSIKFANPKNSNMHFTLTTWHNHLAISGDMGCWVFCRIDDMFEFFDVLGDNISLECAYWVRALVSNSGFGSGKDTGGYSEFDFERTVAVIKEKIPEWEDINEYLITKIDLLEEDTEDVTLRALDKLGIEDVETYHNPTFHIFWCLHAIRWGIMQYESKNR